MQPWTPGRPSIQNWDPSPDGPLLVSRNTVNAPQRCVVVPASLMMACTGVYCAAVHLRPLAHFTARDTWINDPNGLIHHDGVYLNSPNDLVFHSSGALYFTDPPYGLPGQWKDPKKELAYQGVYRRANDGTITQMDLQPVVLGVGAAGEALYLDDVTVG